MKIIYPDGREQMLTAQEFRRRHGSPWVPLAQLRAHQVTFDRSWRSEYQPQGDGIEARF